MNPMKAFEVRALFVPFPKTPLEGKTSAVPEQFPNQCRFYLNHLLNVWRELIFPLSEHITVGTQSKRVGKCGECKTDYFYRDIN